MSFLRRWWLRPTVYDEEYQKLSDQILGGMLGDFYRYPGDKQRALLREVTSRMTNIKKEYAPKCHVYPSKYCYQAGTFCTNGRCDLKEAILDAGGYRYYA